MLRFVVYRRIIILKSNNNLVYQNGKSWCCTIYSYYMGTSDLLEMYAQGVRAYIAGVPMLQLLCHTSKANSFNANTSTTTGFFIYAYLKGPIMVMQQ